MPPIQYARTSDGVNIAYWTLGDGPPLIWIGSLPSNIELHWRHPDARRVIQRLADGHRLVMYDHRGDGASERDVDDVSLETHLADLAAVVDRVGLERFDLVGANVGAGVAAAYTARNAERVSRLVLWSSAPCREDFGNPEAVQSVVELFRQNWGLARRAMADLVFPSGPLELQRWYSDALRDSMSQQVAAKRIAYDVTVDVRALMAQVKAPTLVLHREGDRTCPINAGRATAALIPDARFVALEGDIAHAFLGDMSWLDTVAEFIDEGRTPAHALAHAPSPGAFRTILFTDVEASTTLTDTLGDDRGRAVLREHERVVREALAAHGGAEVKTMGDGFMAAFTSASNALDAAVRMQRAISEAFAETDTPIRMRVGVNAGEPIEEDDDLFGTAVIRAARIMRRASGGEILVSDVVRQLVAGKDYLFSDRGESALEGFDEPARLFELRWRGESGDEG
jgi:class 3 adenylate cyclase/pimeloyl-ACP methyl ester carboxylesterase